MNVNVVFDQHYLAMAIVIIYHDKKLREYVTLKYAILQH